VCDIVCDIVGDIVIDIRLAIYLNFSVIEMKLNSIIIVPFAGGCMLWERIGGV
jgi:hypothetical protein